jgi:hypothetical protein
MISVIALEARSGVMKCAGSGLEACARCTRLLARAADRHNAQLNAVCDGYDVATRTWIAPPHIMREE